MRRLGRTVARTALGVNLTAAGPREVAADGQPSAPHRAGADRAADPMQAVGSVRVRSLAKAYERIVGREHVRTHALRDVSFDVRPHEFVAIIGPSGCGKSTVLRILGGLVAPTSGDVEVSGRPVTRPGPDRATVFQHPSLMPWRTVRDNVTLALEFAKVPRDQRRERADAYIELVGLADFADHHPRELSGGMQQRVGLARALAVEPTVLLMDEPFGALDAITRTQMQDELLRIWEQTTKTVIFITHAIEEAVLLADRVIVMGQGDIAREVLVDLPRPRSRRELLADSRSLDLMRELELHLGNPGEGEE
jgi:ABC-type nitrate/sulfonate/bicarbonate transport system ATPase subunit